MKMKSNWKLQPLVVGLACCLLYYGSKHNINNYVTYLGIEFTGSMAHFLNLQKQGCKVMAMPLQQAHTDVVFSQLEDVDLVLLSLVQGSSLLSLEEALLSGKLENHFSSANIKNGGNHWIVSSCDIRSNTSFIRSYVTGSRNVFICECIYICMYKPRVAAILAA